MGALSFMLRSERVYQINYGGSSKIDAPLASITVGLIPRSLLCKEPFTELLKSVIPECFYRESRQDRNWTPD